MFELFDKVRIKSKDIIGTIVDVSTIGGFPKYVIESDVPDLSDGYGGKWKLFDCTENEIEKI